MKEETGTLERQGAATAAFQCVQRVVIALLASVYGMAASRDANLCALPEKFE